MPEPEPVFLVLNENAFIVSLGFSGKPERHKNLLTSNQFNKTKGDRSGFILELIFTSTLYYTDHVEQYLTMTCWKLKKDEEDEEEKEAAGMSPKKIY